MKRFRLNITDKFEDRPRLITAYGRMRGAEVGFVLRPHDHTALLVHIAKDGAHVWETHEGAVSASWPRSLAKVRKSTLQTSAVLLDGDLEGRGFFLREGEDGERVSVAVDVANKVAHRVMGDAPRKPDRAVSVQDAVARIRAAQKDGRKRGPATFRGQWTGALVCDDGQPRVELQRKLASYGWLRIHSGPDGWHWRFERQAKWFTDDAVNEGGPYASLVQAIDAGVAGGLGLVRQACGVRDTTRKSVVDEPPAPDPVGPGTPRVPTKPSARASTKGKPARTPRRATRPRAQAAVATRQSSSPTSADTSDEGSAPGVDADAALLAAFARALDEALAA